MAVRELSREERLSYPYQAIGNIQVTWPDGMGTSATAVVVGRNDVLTATHVVYNPAHGGWATDLDFYFGADYNSTRGTFDSLSFSYSLTSGFRWQAVSWGNQVFTDGDHSTLTSSEAQFDVALIGLSVPLGDTTGWLGMDWGRDNSQTATEVGYPEGSTGMMVGTTSVTKNPTYSIYESTQNDMGRGSSGGPLFTSDWYVIGVKTSGGPSGAAWADIGLLASQLQTAYHTNDTLLPVPASSKGAPASDLVYVFRSEKLGVGITPASFSYFYTTSVVEAERLNSTPSWPWVQKSFSFEAAHSNPSQGLPLYRFWSDKHQSHFFTASLAERDQIVNWSRTGTNGYDWSYEGEGFKVYSSAAPTDALGKSAIPVYRAWMKDKDFDASNGLSGGHFFSANRGDYEQMLTLVGVTGEGVAFYGEVPGA